MKMKIELTEDGYTQCGKWKLVPVEASKEMAITYEDCYEFGYFDHDAYREMITASPKPEFIQQETNEKWCKQCGCNMSAGHLRNCPTLKSHI